MPTAGAVGLHPLHLLADRIAAPRPVGIKLDADRIRRRIPEEDVHRDDAAPRAFLNGHGAKAEAARSWLLRVSPVDQPLGRGALLRGARAVGVGRGKIVLLRVFL